MHIDSEQLAAAVGRHLGVPVAIEGLRRLSGGASRETWSFDAVAKGNEREPLVLRRDPSAQTLGNDRGTEYELLRAAGEAGVPVPRVRFLLEPDDELGAGFVMDRIDGETIPRKILRDGAFAKARPRLARQCGEIAARIHAISTADLPTLPVHEPHEQIAQYEAMLDGFGEPHPAFELALRWLDEHVPPPLGEPTLVHGDFRNGNLVVGPEGIRSVLDWELAHLGDPVEDLGWLCVRSWRFGEVEHRVGGFGSVDELLAGYGADVDPERLRYWEAFGTLKWGIICMVQCFTHLNGFVRSVELATLGRRVCETEWDLLELLEPRDISISAPSVPTSEPKRASVGDSQDRPTAAELAAAVREFLEHDVMPAVDGRLAFHARVAVNALGMLEREATLGPALGTAEHDRLCRLLGRDAALADLTSELAASIRSGALDHRRAEVIKVVRASVAAKLAVANPRYGPSG